MAGTLQMTHQVFAIRLKELWPVCDIVDRSQFPSDLLEAYDKAENEFARVQNLLEKYEGDFVEYQDCQCCYYEQWKMQSSTEKCFCGKKKEMVK